MAEVPPPIEPGSDQCDPMMDSIGFRPGGAPAYMDRQGNAISLRQWGTAHQDEAYTRIAQDYLDNGNIWVSTVWLGMDHSFGHGPPLIFETMVFVSMTKEQVEERRQRWRRLKYRLEVVDRFPWEDLELERYSTEEAREGHRRIVDSLRLGVQSFYERT